MARRCAGALEARAAQAGQPSTKTRSPKPTWAPVAGCGSNNCYHYSTESGECRPEEELRQRKLGIRPATCPTLSFYLPRARWLYGAQLKGLHLQLVESNKTLQARYATLFDDRVRAILSLVASTFSGLAPACCGPTHAQHGPLWHLAHSTEQCGEAVPVAMRVLARGAGGEAAPAGRGEGSNPGAKVRDRRRGSWTGGGREGAGLRGFVQSTTRELRG